MGKKVHKNHPHDVNHKGCRGGTVFLGMNIKEAHGEGKAVSAAAIFKAETHNVIALQIEAGATLKEHTTPVPACLVCISGKAEYSDEKGRVISLQRGD